ncbi:MAG: PRC-barrel domain-containing protein [Bacteroidota bacterium]|jgi:sporulation protein YlmC with PRC-barrel domain
MLQNIKQLYGNKLAAFDGDIGHVKDFYFDDENWVVRYLVADTGSWLTGRLVLLTPHAFGKLDRDEKTLHIKLHKKKIQDSPSIESHKPVSRQYETDYYAYYGWPTYWDGSSMWGIGGYPVVLPPSKKEMEIQKKYHHRDDKHLRSIQEVIGYNIQSVDGEIGHVSSFLVDDKSWAIHELVIETGHWYSGKEILIPTSKVKKISYEEAKVFVSLTKADIQQTAENEISQHIKA